MMYPGGSMSGVPMGTGAMGGQPMPPAQAGGQFEMLMKALQSNPALLQQMLQQAPMGQPMLQGLGQ